MKNIYYYKTINGRNPVIEFVNEQDNDLQEDFLDAKKTQKIPKQDLFLILNRIRELKNAV